MKKLVAVGLTTALLLGCVPTCYAAEDAVTTLTNAIQSFETEVTVKTQDAEGTLQSVFVDNPELFYYFESYSATMSKNGKKSTYTFTYHNTDVAADDVFVVASTDDLNSVIGYALAETMETVPVVFTDSTLSEDDIINAVDDWREDNYLAYMGYMGVNATGYTSTEAAFSTWTGYTLEFLYMEDTETIQQWRQETEEQVLLLCTTLFSLDMPDWEKELVIHDYIVENCTYDQDAESSGDYTSANTAYGCLVEGSAVCEGYAEAANLLFRVAGLTSYYVEGAGESADHAWNCVQIDGEYYWVDVTWDDPVPAEGEEETLKHTYFNLTDSELNTDHSWQSSQYPSCTATVWSYSAVTEALAEISDEDGNVTEVYENYSTENVTTLETLISDLEYALGVESASDSADAETGETQATETQAAETTTPVADTDADVQGHPARTVAIVVVVVLLLLIIAYLIYRRVMYLRMLKRRRRRAAARKRAAQNGYGYDYNGTGPRAGSNQSRSGSSSRKRSSSGGGSSRSSAGRGSSSRSSSSSRNSGRNDRTRRDNPFR